jgi:hypothetical protein
MRKQIARAEGENVRSRERFTLAANAWREFDQLRIQKAVEFDIKDAATRQRLEDLLRQMQTSLHNDRSANDQPGNELNDLQRNIDEIQRQLKKLDQK